MAVPSMAETTKPLGARSQAVRTSWRLGLWFLAAVLAMLICILRWGGFLLVAPDTLPPRVDAAVVLQGSIEGQKARIAGAMRLLQQGVASRVLLSVPKESYWGQSIPPVARAYLTREYGELANRVDFCETGPEVNSTFDEARALSACIRQHAWETIVIVTSNYHTRRAGIIWRKTLPQDAPAVRLWIYGVPDTDFQARGWWRKRIYAKTWFMEFLKLVSTSAGARE